MDDSLRVKIKHAFQDPSEDLNGFSDWNWRLGRSDGHSNMIRKRGFFHDDSSSNQLFNQNEIIHDIIHDHFNELNNIRVIQVFENVRFRS